MTIGGVAVAQEDKITKGFYSFDAMGCMLLKECTDGVEKIKSTEDLRATFPDSDWDYISNEFDRIMLSSMRLV